MEDEREGGRGRGCGCGCGCSRDWGGSGAGAGAGAGEVGLTATSGGFEELLLLLRTEEEGPVEDGLTLAVCIPLQ